MKKKRVIIIEGPDASGKSTLCKHIQELTNGKCHTMHSNFDKELPKESHRMQHRLITDFVIKQFSPEYYTGNHTVILDRCYISDMTYGLIGYGSRGTLSEKFEYLDELLNKFKDKDIEVYLIYCKPDKNIFNKDAKEELLTYDEDNTINKLYNDVMFNETMKKIIDVNNIKYYHYNFMDDSDFSKIDEFLAF